MLLSIANTKHKNKISAFSDTQSPTAQMNDPRGSLIARHTPQAAPSTPIIISRSLHISFYRINST